MMTREKINIKTETEEIISNGINLNNEKKQ